MALAPAGAAEFSWPVQDPQLTQSYAAFNAIGNGEYHTGFDLVSNVGNEAVYAAASGTARVLPLDSFANDNHGLGNVVILDHGQGEGPFTLYGHLASFQIQDGDTVSGGEQIATMGNTGCADDGCGVHLHFEVKRWEVLGNLDDDAGPEWGYTPGVPNLYGYQNPWPYLDYDLLEPDRPVVEADSDQIVRTGPDSSLYTLTVDSVDQGQRFVAFRRHGDWYEVDVPSPEGPATGWILASSQSSVSRVEVDDPVRGTIGVNVRSSPTIDSSALSNVWDDQWLAVLDTATAGNGCSTEWTEVSLPGSAGDATGWVCGEYLLEQDAPSCHDLSLGHSGQGSDPVPSPTESSGCPAGTFVAGEVISLTAAPASGWIVDSWSGTDDDLSTSTSNSLTMPDGSHAVSVTYVEEDGSGACTDDVYEDEGSDSSDDSCFGTFMSIGETQSHAHCDEDWVWFVADEGRTYEIKTLNLGGGADTVLELYNSCSIFLASNDDDVGLASRIVWTPSADTTLDVRITEFGGVYEDGETYDVQIECIANCGGCNDLTLADQTISTSETYTACGSVTLGPGLTLSSTADVVVEAGGTVIFEDGVSIEGGAGLTVSSDGN